MRFSPTTRALTLVAVVITVSLGAVYLIGWSVSRVVNDASRPATEVAARRAAGTESVPPEDRTGAGDRAGAGDRTGAGDRAGARPAPSTGQAGSSPGRPAGQPGAGGTPPAGQGTSSSGQATSPSGQGGPSAGAAGTRAPAGPTVGATPQVPESDGTARHTVAERPRLSLQLHGGPYGSRSTTGSQEVALTFDDGPDPSYTPQTLTLLRQYQVRATFCLVGVNVEQYPELVRAIAADGHTLCNHSWSHDLSLGRRSRAAIEGDLVRTNEAIRQAAPGARIPYFRQPGGNWTPRVVSVAHELGMTSLHWAVDPQDWRRPGAGSISATVTGGAFGGAIVLLHDAGGDRQQTVTALRSILPNLTRRFQLAALPRGLDSPERQALAPAPRPG